MPEKTVTLPIEDEKEYTKDELIKVTESLAKTRFKSSEKFRNYIEENKFGNKVVSQNSKAIIISIINAIYELPELDEKVEEAEEEQKKVTTTIPAGMNLDEIGVRPHTQEIDVPVEKEKKGNLKIMSVETVQRTENLAQPFLTIKEVKDLKMTLKWHAYRGNKEILTTVINGRRLMLKRADFETLKAEGLVVEGEPASKYVR